MTSLRRSSAWVLCLGLILGSAVMGCSGDDDGPAAPQLDTTAPAVPANVAATVIDGVRTSVRVSWDANTTDADLSGYLVYRSHVPDGSYLPVDDAMLVQTNNWVDTSVQRGGTYYYRVAARDAASNESALSDPTGLTVTVGDDSDPPRLSD